jgi:hypothetical protein
MERNNPFGSFRLKLYNSPELVDGTFNSEWERDYFISEISKDNEVESASVSRLIDGKIVTEVIFNNGINEISE